MKKTLVIFEGVDGSGKTSLAKALANSLNARYEHNDKSRSYEEGRDKSYKYFEKLKDMDDNILVIDRLVHTGEAVYAPIYRGYDGSDYFEHLESLMLEEFNVLMIYVKANKSTLINRLNNRGEDYIDSGDLNELMINYRKYIKSTQFTVYEFLNEYTRLDIAENDIIKNVNHLLELFF